MIRSFGQYICKKAPQDPDLTRKLLLAGYRAFGLKLRVAPDRHLPPARQFSAQYINRTMIRMLSHPEKAALVSIFMPCELLEAMDIVPTGSGAASGAKKALDAALAQAGLSFSDMDAIVTTGYGRETIGVSDASVTEITCHARGANFLYPKARTVIDIGGQDSKVIRIDENGAVINFVMNDKCAAGTGRFLDMMARTMELKLSDMSEMGLHWKNEVAISSMCTVFAESEVVSLIAENTPAADIIHGLNLAVAGKTISLVHRLKGEPSFIMTGGVAQNKGVVKALEEKLGESIYVSEKAQLCGAIGAALIAMDGGQ